MVANSLDQLKKSWRDIDWNAPEDRDWVTKNVILVSVHGQSLIEVEAQADPMSALQHLAGGWDF